MNSFVLLWNHMMYHLRERKHEGGGGVALYDELGVLRLRSRQEQAASLFPKLTWVRAREGHRGGVQGCVIPVCQSMPDPVRNRTKAMLHLGGGVLIGVFVPFVPVHT